MAATDISHNRVQFHPVKPKFVRDNGCVVPPIDTKRQNMNGKAAGKHTCQNLTVLAEIMVLK